MLLTVHQQYLLDCLREISYIHRKNLHWLLRLKFGTSEAQLHRDLSCLERLGKLTLHGKAQAFVSLPNSGGMCNPLLLSAVDVMVSVCGNSLPEFFGGEPPCVLSFYLRDERGYLDFKIIPVPIGAEQMVMEQLRRQYKNFKCTWLFLLENHEQIKNLHTENPACFVFRNKAGGYDFLRKQSERR